MKREESMECTEKGIQVYATSWAYTSPLGLFRLKRSAFAFQVDRKGGKCMRLLYEQEATNHKGK
jgi:hypothetical protein